MSASISANIAGIANAQVHRQRAWPKLTAVLHTHSHLIVGAVTGVGPSQDSPEFTPVMRQAASILSFGTVRADAGYDAEHNHRLCLEEQGVTRSVIALNRRPHRVSLDENAVQAGPSAPLSSARLPYRLVGTSRVASVSTSAASAHR